MGPGGQCLPQGLHPRRRSDEFEARHGAGDADCGDVRVLDHIVVGLRQRRELRGQGGFRAFSGESDPDQLIAGVLETGLGPQDKHAQPF